MSGNNTFNQVLKYTENHLVEVKKAIDYIEADSDHRNGYKIILQNHLNLMTYYDCSNFMGYLSTHLLQNPSDDVKRLAISKELKDDELKAVRLKKLEKCIISIGSIWPCQHQPMMKKHPLVQDIFRKKICKDPRK